MATSRELLEKLITAYEHHEKKREEDFRTISSYNPYPGDQPCSDEEMGDYDQKEDGWAYEAQSVLRNFVNEARKCLEMENK
ncbi:hypothetical protein ACWDUX_30405 [Streptomyces sp. NPDC003444]